MADPIIPNPNRSVKDTPGEKPADELAQLVARIKSDLAAVASAAQNVVEKAKVVGEDLIRAKDRVEHSKWKDWLTSNFALSQRSAERYMQLANGWTKLQGKLDDKTRHGMANLSLNKAIALIAEVDAETNKSNDNKQGEGKQGEGPAPPQSAAPTPAAKALGRLDTSIDTVIERLNKVEKDAGVEQAISEARKAIKKLQVKMNALLALKAERDMEEEEDIKDAA
jgi:hypothetical protein